MSNFIVSTDSCADMTPSWYKKNDVQYIVMKRVLGGKEISEVFEKDSEFDTFYEGIKRGDLPTTTQLNPFEVKTYFEDILKSTPSGDIIHIALSSGLSATHQNTVSAASEVNKELEKNKINRRIYVPESFSATLAQGQIIEELVRLREQGVTTKEALAKTEKFLAHQHGWVIMTDLFHLKRGGRISPAKAAIGSILNIRPIIHLSAKGKLAIENKERGNKKAIKYVLSRMEKYGEKADANFAKSTVWVVRTSKSDLFEEVIASIRAAYPDVHIRTAIVGPVIGTHLGCGGVAILWQGAPRLDIE
ncbi:MAG: DegV family protein [Christensenellaceae bacterium]|jgi:DegV family protein with EDD domain|nr:DegV family protein [Christensenellaceae bacterium]